MVGIIKDQSDTAGCRQRTNNFHMKLIFALIFIGIFSVWFFLEDVLKIFISLIDWCHFWDFVCIFSVCVTKRIRFLHMLVHAWLQGLYINSFNSPVYTEQSFGGGFKPLKTCRLFLYQTFSSSGTFQWNANPFSAF